MRLYNALSESVESFPLHGQNLSVYVCGITPYDTTHLGHAFTYCAFDILIRYLELRGSRVRYTQNVTDIDDDILKRAAKVGQDWRSLGNEWTAHFIRDMQSLNVRPPDYYPRATDVIPDILEEVQRLLDAGVAYAAGGSVYFHVAAWPEYGKLSHIPREEMLAVANERGNTPDDPHKRDPLDFVLWQAQAPGEPAWDSPWGPGRPGWHIECSTMVTHILGEPVDIHGGGLDLIFPHHESEIAQGEAAQHRRPFSRFWMHTAMVRHEGEKMSKSLGNLIMMRDLLKEWPADALRLYMGRHHYRASWSHDEAALRQAGELAARFRAAVNAASGAGRILDPAPASTEFAGAMEDDLNADAAANALDRLAGEILKAAEAGQDVHSAQAVLHEMGRVFGLPAEAGQPEPRVLAGWGAHLKRFE